MNKLIYIAGPYSSPDKRVIRRNISRAKFAALWCAANRIPYICPHLNSRQFSTIAGSKDWEFFIKMDLLILSRCDGLILLPQWKESNRATIELNHAQRLGLRTFLYPEDKDCIIKWGHNNG